MSEEQKTLVINTDDFLNATIAEPPKPELTEAQKRLQEMEIAVLKLDQWEQAEIRFNVDKIHKMLRQYHSSAAMAVIQVSLEIAVQQGR